MTSSNGPASSVVSKPSATVRHGRSMSNEGGADKYGLREKLYLAAKDGRDGRSMSNASLAFGPRVSSLAPSAPHPGSFSSDLKTVVSARAGAPRLDSGGGVTGDYSLGDNPMTSEQRQTELRDKINKETKIKIGSENLLEALISKHAKQTKDQRLRVESELSSSNRKLIELKSQLEDEIDRANRPNTPSRARLSGLFQGSPLKSPAEVEEVSQPETHEKGVESESPTYILEDILQTLEREAMQPDYYVERANNLVDLFKRYPTLKYDLSWPVFGLRVQTMLLSESREVVAAGYRVTRHAIADRRSLQIIRKLNTDNIIILSLVKDGKASVEREQALKLIRAFLDVKDGVNELSNAVIRTVVSVAEHHEDRLRCPSLLTISEILVREPSKAISTGGVAPLLETFVDGGYHGSESLAMTVLHLLDNPQQRNLLQSGHGLETVFTPFTDPVAVHGHGEKLKSSAKIIAAIMKTWTGIFMLSSIDFSPIRSLLLSLSYPVPLARGLILDLLFNILHIKSPSWASSYLAGRRLTTYGRVSNLKPESQEANYKLELSEEGYSYSLVDHFTALLLAILHHCGLVKVHVRRS